MTFKIHIDITNHHTPPDKLPYITPTVTFEEIEGGGVICQSVGGSVSNIESGNGTGGFTPIEEGEAKAYTPYFLFEDEDNQMIE